MRTSREAEPDIDLDRLNTTTVLAGVDTYLPCRLTGVDLQALRALSEDDEDAAEA